MLAGGASATSPLPYWVLAVFAVFLELELVSDTALSAGAGVAALAAALAGLVVAKLVLDRSAFRHGDDDPMPTWAVASLGLLLGVVTGLPFSVALVADGSDMSAAPVPGLLAGGVLRCIVVFPVCAYLVGLRRWYVSARRAAERELVRAETARIEAGDDVEATRSLIIEAARREISPSQREASQLLGVAMRSEAPGDVTRAAASLRSAARSAVRSTSHELWVDDGGAPAIRWRSIVPASLVRYPLPLLLALFAIVGSTIVRSYWLRSPGPGLALAFAIVVAIPCVVYLAGRALIARAPGVAIPVTAAAVVMAPVVSQFAVAGILDRAIAPIPTAGVILVVAALTIASSIVLMVRDSGAAVIQAMVDDRARADAQQAALQMLNKRLSRELAAYLHGTVQPQLLAASVALDAAVAADDPQAIADAVAQSERALGLAVRPPEPEPTRPLHDMVARLTARWDALLEIVVEVQAPPGVPPPPGGVTRALDECLNNAVIHGQSTRAHVRISHAPGGWDIQVADDGMGPTGGAPGLGSSVLDELTGGDWSLGPAPGGGAVVRAHVPDRAATPAG